jgi:hypothetical protein
LRIDVFEKLDILTKSEKGNEDKNEVGRSVAFCTLGQELASRPWPGTTTHKLRTYP